MSVFKKNRLVLLQLLAICGTLLLFQYLAHLFPNTILGLIMNLVLIIIWTFLAAMILTFLGLQIIHNFRFERSFIPSKLKIKPLPELKNYHIANPLEQEGTFFKAQLHTHSSLSYDSKTPPLQVIESYKKDGYHILAITDHDLLSDFSKYSTLNFLILPGIEKTVPALFWPIPLGKHLVLINLKEKRIHSKKVQELVDQAFNHQSIAMPAHLGWRGGAGTGRWYPLELNRLKNLQFVEIDNPHSKDPSDLTIWHKLIINNGPEHPVWGVAVDDSHAGSSKSGWVMIKTSQLDVSSIINSLKKGAFFATNGPTNLEITIEGTLIHVYSPGAAWIRFINAQNQVVMAVRAEEAVYPSSGDEGFIRVEVSDQNQHTAWSQPMWLIANAPRKSTKKSFRNLLRRKCFLRSSRHHLRPKNPLKAFHF
ncbi:MAG TPA: hypothetical protein DDW50_19150 [Firmicutes bacterium]|nr:hypothetical protein [Bacillota bacterium]